MVLLALSLVFLGTVRLQFSCLYGVRMGRYDPIRPVQALARLTTEWDHLCDRKLHRLVCYINSTLDLNLYGWVGDPPHMLDLVVYYDADLAGDRTVSKSTSGMCMCLLGPRTVMPLNAMSKKQTSVSKSTPEAENASLDHAIYKLGLPALDLWECVMNRKFSLHIMEDNEAAIRVIVTGHNPNMRTCHVRSALTFLPSTNAIMLRISVSLHVRPNSRHVIFLRRHAQMPRSGLAI